MNRGIFLEFHEFLGNWWLMSDKTVSSDVAFNFGELWMLAASLAMALGTILIRFTCTKMIQLQLQVGTWF